MTLEELKKHIKELCIKHPDKEGELIDSFQLCLDEIEAGESTQNEINHCLYHTEEIIDEE